MSEHTIKIWNGVSHGESVSAYLTGLTDYCRNEKLGPLALQISVLADRLKPSEAVHEESCNNATCNGCVLRPDHFHACVYCNRLNAPFKRVCCECGEKLPVCYVNRTEGLRSVYQHSVAKPVTSLETTKSLIKKSALRGMNLLRLGLFGNVSVIDYNVLEPICLFARNRLGMKITGYISDWIFQPEGLWLNKYCLASVGMDQEGNSRKIAHQLGWSTFRIRRPGDRPLRGEHVCKHDKDRTFCMNCGICNGCNGDVVVKLH
jgi:hypothetical protein